MPSTAAFSPFNPLSVLYEAGLQRYSRHVAQTDDGTVGICPDDNFFKFVYGGKTSRSRDGDGDVRPAHRLLAEYPGRRFPVLIFQYVL